MTEEQLNPRLVVSPHLDDAVLSTGQLLGAMACCTVVTCLTTCPTPQILTSYDRNCGFNSSGQAVKGRRAEDDQAMAKVRATPVRLDFPDGQYGAAVTVDELALRIGAAIEEADVVDVAGPVGIEHPDHRLVAEAFARVLRTRTYLSGWIYEELPSRVLWPEQVPERLAWWGAQGFKVERAHLAQGPLDLKAAALRCYRSQLWALDWNACLVPERFWRVQ